LFLTYDNFGRFIFSVESVEPLAFVAGETKFEAIGTFKSSREFECEF
jgi:hypothetical protein